MLKFKVLTDQGDFVVEGRNHGEARDQIDQRFKYNASIYQIIDLGPVAPPPPAPVADEAPVAEAQPQAVPAAPAPASKPVVGGKRR